MGESVSSVRVRVNQEMRGASGRRDEKNEK
jgi:hypothetical protein